ncbi:hypothetical protein HYS00_04190 [Candidatus Microgenomates bacterium]|nr:hypothetical protein [Candidatus Microgenomates bacterium]
MGTQRHSRHQTNGKKTAHSTGALKTVLEFDIINSFMLVLMTGLRPEVVAAAEMVTHFVPP